MHQPTVRVLEVLNYIIKEKQPQRLADLSHRLSIPKSTLLPILQTLCEYRYLSHNNFGEYEMGAAIYSFGTQLKGKFPLMEYVDEKLKSIVTLLGETCYFGILDDGSVLYLNKSDSAHSLQVLITTGKRLPAYATGIGKALLSDMTKEELRSLYPQGLKPLTEKTVTDIDVLASQMNLARKKGYAEEAEESTQHIRCFAVPIRKHGKIVAAISVAIPVFRYDESKRDYIIEILKNTASEIGDVIENTDAVIE